MICRAVIVVRFYVRGMWDPVALPEASGGSGLPVPFVWEPAFCLLVVEKHSQSPSEWQHNQVDADDGELLTCF